jgi:drug/metabolite transporter (DMT)-like permease
MILIGLAAALLASALYNLGSALQALDAREAPPEEGLQLRLLARLMRRRRWLVGLVLGGLGFPLQVAALAMAPFVLVQPALAAGLLLLLVMGNRMLGERVGRAEIGAVLATCGGIALLAWGAPAHTETVRSEVDAVSVVALCSALSLVPFALRGGKSDFTLLVIVGSALGFGASNIATKFVSDGLTNGHLLIAATWIAVAAVTGVAATVTEMTALQRRPATFVIPISFGLQTFLPVVIEPLYLREDWSSAAAGGVPLLLGLLLVLAGAIAIARNHSVSELAAGGEERRPAGVGQTASTDR